MRFEREIFAPLPLDFIFPYFERFSFYDHHGSFREAWSEPACSVGDRPTDVEPSEGKYHFVMDVHDFLSVYPFPIGMHISSVTCTFVTFAQNARWEKFVVDGSMLRTAEEFLSMLYIGSRAASETSPGVLRHIIGPPSYCRGGATSSAPRLKGCTSGQAVKPAGRPEHSPSAADKAAVLEVPGDGGNSGAAEACAPSTASDSLSIERPASSFLSFTLARTAGSKFNITKSTKTR